MRPPRPPASLSKLELCVMYVIKDNELGQTRPQIDDAMGRSMLSTILLLVEKRLVQRHEGGVYALTDEGLRLFREEAACLHT